MSKFYMRLYEIFNSVANYFWKKSLNHNYKKRGKDV
tara:strand:- start:380 stop:487 length:108 start_codon:yes stop_codon:yes gene_type:complete